MAIRFLPPAIGALALLSATAATAGPVEDFVAKEKVAKAGLMADPRRALALSNEAERLAHAIPDPKTAAMALASANWMQAEAMLGLNQIDGAAAPAQAAAAAVARAGPRTKLAGDIERTLGAIAGARGDVEQALRRYQAAYRNFTSAGEQRSRAMALLDIGQVYWEAGDYARVLRYFDQAEELMPADDAGLQLALYNGRGEALRAMRRFAEAETAYAQALTAATALKSPMLQARILTNLANAQGLGGRPAQAAASVRRGLALAQAPDVAEWRPFLFGAAARVAERRGDPEGAAAYLDQAFAGQDIAKTAMPYRELHEVAAVVYERLGRQEAAFQHLRAFQRLDKEAQTLVANNSAQLMAAQFDFTNQNLKISQLKQGQLERDIRIERQRAQFRNWLFGGLLGAAAIIFAILTALYLNIRRSRDRLAVSNTALAKALAAKTEFLATTSHEIRTPLNGILGMTQVMLANRAIEPGVREQIKVVHGAGEAMRALVDDILDVAKMEAGEIEAQHDAVDLTALLTDAATMWRGHADGKGIALELDVSDAPACIRSDAGRLRQIVSNLLSNAVKFTPAGHVRLTASARGETLVLAVEDTGIGIAADHLEAIFEPFHQIDGGMNRQFAGTGLGLAICRNLSRALGGDVAVTSSLGAGSTFTVTLPLVEEAAAPARAPVGALAEARLLVVESNQLAQGMLGSVLEQHVERVTFVVGGDEATRGLAQADHLLIEARSSGTGEDASLASLRALVEAGQQAGLRTSILAAPSEVFPLDQVAVIGADQVIVKPVGGRQLVAALHDLYPAADPVAPPAPASAITAA